MPLFAVDTLGPSPDPTQTLVVLAEAMNGRVVERSRRVVAHDDRKRPDEGLALLSAYVSISDRRVRQAILDVLMTIAEADPAC